MGESELEMVTAVGEWPMLGRTRVAAAESVVGGSGEGSKG